MKNTNQTISERDDKLNLLLERSEDYLNMKLTNITTSDRVKASRLGKELVIGINEYFKKDNNPELMDKMKELTLKKRKVESRLNKRVSRHY